MISPKVHQQELTLDRLNFWVYGDSGVGKTRFAATWPNPVFLLADEGGLMSVTLPVGVIEIRSWRDLQQAWVFLTTQEHSYETVVIDTLNEVQHLAMRQVLSEFTHIKRSYGSLPGQSDYGKALYDFDLLVREFIKLPMHKVFISQVRRQEFPTDPVLPQLIGKNTAGNLTKLMSVIGFMYRVQTTTEEGGEQVIPVMGFNELDQLSKDRTGQLPPTIQEPTFAKCAVYWQTLQKG